MPSVVTVVDSPPVMVERGGTVTGAVVPVDVPPEPELPASPVPEVEVVPSPGRDDPDPSEPPVRLVMVSPSPVMGSLNPAVPLLPGLLTPFNSPDAAEPRPEPAVVGAVLFGGDWGEGAVGNRLNPELGLTGNTGDAESGPDAGPSVPDSGVVVESLVLAAVGATVFDAPFVEPDPPSAEWPPVNGRNGLATAAAAGAD